MSTTAANPVLAGTVAREEFGAREIATLAETSSAAMAAQAKAHVEARYLLALKRPRDPDQVRVALLKECRRPSLAAVAIYHKPIGKGVEGPSIRFAEAAARCLGNLLPEAASVYDDREKRIVRVSVTDLEVNLTYTKDVTVTKLVERQRLRDGQVAVSQRTNSQGKTTYLVEASEDDLLSKEGSLISKALRTLILRVVPGDLIDEAMATVRATLANEAAQDPDAARKKLADAFAGIGIQPAALKEYLGHELATTSPAEIVHLRSVYAAIRDGETTWAEALAAAKEEKGAPAASGAAAPTPATWKMTKDALTTARRVAGKKGIPIEEVERLVAEATKGRAHALAEESFTTEAEFKTVVEAFKGWKAPAPAAAVPPPSTPAAPAGGPPLSPTATHEEPKASAEQIATMAARIEAFYGKGADAVAVASAIVQDEMITALDQLTATEAKAVIDTLDAKLKTRTT